MEIPISEISTIRHNPATHGIVAFLIPTTNLLPPNDLARDLRPPNEPDVDDLGGDPYATNDLKPILPPAILFLGSHAEAVLGARDQRVADLQPLFDSTFRVLSPTCNA